MTGEEKQQVQNLINARTKLLSEKAARQEEQIKSLNDRIITLNAEIQERDSELEARRQELEALKSQLSEAQEQSRKLLGLVQSGTTAPQSSEPAQKPNYLLSLLRQHFGFDSFRPGQEEITDALLSGRDVFCSMPEHYGMSVCYRLPALLMPGLTLAVTPDDPPETLTDSHSAVLTPSLTPAKRRDILRKAKNGTCKILCSTLEQLQEPDAVKALKGTDISLAAMFPRWGMPHNLEGWRQFMGSISTRRITSAIFTDSTSPALRQELLKLTDLHSPLKVITGFRREGVSIRIIRTENKQAALNEILEQKQGLSGVIYCSTPETSFKLRETLRDYDGLNERIIIMPAILYREIDRKDIRFTVHYDLPENLGDYSQQVNIAGLDGSKSECIVLASRNDLRNVDRSVISFCEAKNPQEFMLSYLGEDEKPKPEHPESESVRITPDDVSDFDFGSANEAQKEAITTTSGPLLIIAGPGTGKTFTLVQRVVFLIQKKRVNPGSILLASFTDKAAHELTTRITEELSRRNITADTGAMYAGTFHSICERILKEYSDFTGRKKNFRVLDEFDQAYTIMQNMKTFEAIPGISQALVTAGRWANSCELRDYINTLSEELTDPEELLRDPDPSVNALGHALKLHDAILSENNSLSYSALLVETYRLLRENPEILGDLQAKIKYIMVDEYQDTNYVQEQLALMLAGDGRNICAAGDDDQSIYRFRGAAVRNILEFPGKFGKNECRIVRLMLNYRSRPGIIDFFSEWMNDTEKFFTWGDFRHSKKLEAFRPGTGDNPSVMRLAGLNDKNEWREKVLHFLQSLKASGKMTDYSQAAFLFRSVKSQDAREMSQYLEENNISVYSPRSNMFFQRGEVKFALGCMISMFPGYLKALNSGAFNFQGKEPGYITYYKGCLQNVDRYMGRQAYSGLKKWLVARREYHAKLQGYTGYTYSDILYRLFAFMPFSHALDADINGTVKDLRPARNLSRLVHVIRKYEHSYNINNLHAKYMAGQFQMMMNIYLRFMIDDGLDEYEGEDGSIPSGHVAFLTIHQAKGMEFPVVFTDSLGASPSENVNRERNNDLMQKISREHYRRPEFEPSDSIKYFDFWRLYYTAFSRAQDMLILTCSEDSSTPSKYFEESYNNLDDADDTLRLSELDITPAKGSALRNTYSFTSHILTYETCPVQYKFFRELDFMPGRSHSTFTGTLVHAVLEDIHRAVINHEESRINEPNITEWFNAEYSHLSRSLQEYLPKTARDTALAQVMRYVKRQGSDWSAIRRAEYEVNVVRENYILEGKIDLISIRDGETEITDFKSGTKPNININRDRERLESSRRQVFAYAFMVEHSSGLKVRRMRLYYTGDETGNPEIIYDYDNEEAEKIMTGFDETVGRIMAKDFSRKAPDIETCKECVFRYYCGRE
ncbi:MAG: UvrD-helicase domain-containing protein [Synergistaceae bacterium]|nr:UvrD-helicase domain-containing protein [Synergistaceae bacterium]